MNSRSYCVRLLQMTLLAVSLFWAPAKGQAQQAGAAFPEFENEFFNDFTSSASSSQKIEITRNLRLGSESSQIHTMIVVIRKMADYPSMPQEALALATRLAQERKVGSQKTQQGILALFCLEDHKFAVAKSNNLPQSLSDSVKDALSTRMRNKFKEGQFGQGLVYAAEDIASSLPKAKAAGVPAKPQAMLKPAAGHAAAQAPPGTETSSFMDKLPSKASEIGLGTILLTVFGGIAICSLLSRLFSGGGGGGSGGFGSGGGSGLGGMLGGLLGGGLLGYWLGNSSSSSGGLFGSHSDSGTSSAGDNEESRPSDSGGFDSFGGGDYGGGGDSGGGGGSDGDF